MLCCLVELCSYAYGRVVDDEAVMRSQASIVSRGVRARDDVAAHGKDVSVTIERWLCVGSVPHEEAVRRK